MLPPWPSDTRDTIESIIGMIGREIDVFYTASSIACSACVLDPVTNTSTDSYCQTCSGLYWIPQYSGVTMSAHVTWRSEAQPSYPKGGIVLEGDATVKVMYSEERERIIKSADFLLVDGKIMDVRKVTVLGAPSVNRILVSLKERKENE
jgi:hypothetical protein